MGLISQSLYSPIRSTPVTAGMFVVYSLETQKLRNNQNKAKFVITILPANQQMSHSPESPPVKAGGASTAQSANQSDEFVATQILAVDDVCYT